MEAAQSVERVEAERWEDRRCGTPAIVVVVVRILLGGWLFCRFSPCGREQRFVEGGATGEGNKIGARRDVGRHGNAAVGSHKVVNYPLSSFGLGLVVVVRFFLLLRGERFRERFVANVLGGNVVDEPGGERGTENPASTALKGVASGHTLFKDIHHQMLSRFKYISHRNIALLEKHFTLSAMILF